MEHTCLKVGEHRYVAVIEKQKSVFESANMATLKKDKHICVELVKSTSMYETCMATMTFSTTP